MKRNGFTLIELLIVIAIIGILTSLLMVNFIAVRERARDAERKSDLRQIQSALELYRSDQSLYPESIPNGPVGSSCEESLVADPDDSSCSSPTYMKTIPKDPTLSQSGSGYFYYEYFASSNSYTLAACLENKGDATANVLSTEAAQTEFSAVSLGGCDSNKFYVLQNP